jgi:hypothetical protein
MEGARWFFQPGNTLTFFQNRAVAAAMSRDTISANKTIEIRSHDCAAQNDLFHKYDKSLSKVMLLGLSLHFFYALLLARFTHLGNLFL